MTDISKHPLLRLIYEATQAVEKCGASVLLTDAVMAVTKMYAPAERLLDERDQAVREREEWKEAANKNHDIAASFHTRALSAERGWEEARARVVELERDRAARRAIDPAERLHNLYDALAESRGESPYDQESWDLADECNRRLQAEVTSLQAERDSLRAEVAGLRKDAERWRKFRLLADDDSVIDAPAPTSAVDLDRIVDTMLPLPNIDSALAARTDTGDAGK